jgi:ABC-type dipeptide/oligopeptide/nickel transport system permease subunit
VKPPVTTAAGPWATARRRFLRNVPATVALVYLTLNGLVAVIGYPLLPDDTTHANFQLVELPKQAPGTAVVYFNQPIYPQPAQPGWWDYYRHGRPDAFRPLVTASVQRTDRNTMTAAYIDLRGKGQALSVPEFLLPLDKLAAQSQAWRAESGRPYALTGNVLQYFGTDGATHAVDADSLMQAFLDNHVVRRTFLMGTDGAGRDLWSRLMLGARLTLGIGLMAVLVSLLLGVTLGALAGFFRGRVDAVIMWLVSVVWSVPTMLLAIALAFALGKGTWQLFLAIGISSWVEVARIVRGQIFRLREMQFVEAAKALGYSPVRTILRHVLPNTTGPLLIVATANFAAAVLLEAGLSFLGVGVMPPAPSWGSMIREGYTQVMFDSGAWLAIFPCLAMVLVVISLNLVGLGLRDALDPDYDRSK